MFSSRPQIQVVRNKENPYSRVRSPLLPDAAKGRQVRERDVRAKKNNSRCSHSYLKEDLADEIYMPQTFISNDLVTTNRNGEISCARSNDDTYRIARKTTN